MSIFIGVCNNDVRLTGYLNLFDDENYILMLERLLRIEGMIGYLFQLLPDHTTVIQPSLSKYFQPRPPRPDLSPNNVHRNMQLTHWMNALLQDRVPRYYYSTGPMLALLDACVDALAKAVHYEKDIEDLVFQHIHQTTLLTRLRTQPLTIKAFRARERKKTLGSFVLIRLVLKPKEPSVFRNDPMTLVFGDDALCGLVASYLCSCFTQAFLLSV